MKAALVSPSFSAQAPLHGAERLISGLFHALQNIADVEWVQVPVSEATWDGVLKSYLDCYDLDLGKYDLVVSTKNPTFMVQHPNHICWLLHQIRVFYDRFDDEYGHCPHSSLVEQEKRRKIIHRLDNHALGRVLKIFTIGHEVARRLRVYNGFDAEVLHPPLLKRSYFCGGQEYLLLPGRLHRWKRVDLAIRALKLISDPIDLLIAGTGEDEPYFKEVAAGDPRIKFLGYVSDEELVELYAHALAVLFVPKEEDFGYITLEAMMSHKPVITCVDSGEPSRLVQGAVTGLVVPPHPKQLAAAIQILVRDRKLARDLGENGFRTAPRHSWDDVVRHLLEAGRSKPKATHISIRHRASPPPKVVVTDSQTLDPPIGGSRVRLKHLCEAFAGHFETTYVGAYDWPGPNSLDHMVTPSFRSVILALSSLQYRIAARLQECLITASAIDITFPLLGRFSRNFVKSVRAAVRNADVIVISHPWVFPLIRKQVRGKLLIYASENFEYNLRRLLLPPTLMGRVLARYVRKNEKEIARHARAIMVCSKEDGRAMAAEYGVPESRFFMIPNCADTGKTVPADDDGRLTAKKKLGWQGRFVSVFVGSGYWPNTEATSYLVEWLAPRFPEVLFVIAGSVKESYLRTPSGSATQLDVSHSSTECLLPDNVRLLGVVDEDVLGSVLKASDIAINPIEFGSGTNLKMLQFMAAGLPILSTPAGTRGIEEANSFCLVANRSDFETQLRGLLNDATLRTRLGRTARNVAVQSYDWARAGELAVGIIEQKLKYARQLDPPFLSVIVPTYQRPRLLRRLLEALSRQTFPDFEVIIVDQSETPSVLDASAISKLRLKLIHTNEKGATRARNRGLREARGLVLAFTDDDCIPAKDWLERAVEQFDRREIAGVEGRIRTSKVGDPYYRTVSNIGFEGLGFMTANLFLRKELVERLGGFDVRFDQPHFREDTDLAWRVLEYGEIPYAADVAIYHPPHSVRVRRESLAERAKMFVHDPLLFVKHPQRYLQLFFAEGHYRKTRWFWTYFLAGIERHRVEPPVEALLDELEKRDPDFWRQMQTPVEENHAVREAQGLAPSDIAAVRFLAGLEPALPPSVTAATTVSL